MLNEDGKLLFGRDANPVLPFQNLTEAVHTYSKKSPCDLHLIDSKKHFMVYYDQKSVYRLHVDH